MNLGNKQTPNEPELRKWMVDIESAFQHDFGAEFPTELRLKWSNLGWFVVLELHSKPFGQAPWKRALDASQKCPQNPDP